MTFTSGMTGVALPNTVFGAALFNHRVFQLTTLAIVAPVPSVLDHFKLFKVDDARELELVVDLVDQFGEQIGVKVEEAEFFGNPVDKNGEGISNENAHLTCYKIEDDGNDEERVLEIENQFGLQTLEIKEAKLLCVPTEKIDVVLIKDDD